MKQALFIICIVGIASVNAIFFSSGGGCCQQSCGCAPQPSCCSAPQPCGYSQPVSYFQPQVQQSSYVQPHVQQSSYVQPAANCQPRYIIVRPGEQVPPIPPVQPIPSVPAIPVQSQNYAQVQSELPPSPITSELPAQAEYKTNKVHASKTILVDTRCSSAELRQLLEEQIVPDDANESKRRIHKAANEQFETSKDSDSRGIDVICAPGAFSYRIATDFFCEHAKGSITCFAYQQHSN